MLDLDFFTSGSAAAALSAGAVLAAAAGAGAAGLVSAALVSAAKAPVRPRQMLSSAKVRIVLVVNFLLEKQKKMQFSVRLYLDKSTVLLRDDAFHIQTFQCVHAMPFLLTQSVHAMC